MVLMEVMSLTLIPTFLILGVKVVSITKRKARKRKFHHEKTKVSQKAVKERFSLTETEATKPNMAQHNFFHAQMLLSMKGTFANIVRTKRKPISK